MITYSQNFEDIIINRCFQNKQDGFYIDVGASSPVVDSVTLYFYEKGWCGINIEPIAERIAELEYSRPRDVNLRLALSNKFGTEKFYKFPGMGGLSTLKPSIAEDLGRNVSEQEEILVDTLTLEEVCTRYSVKKDFEFLKIDVEGAEREVLEGADFSRWRPEIVLVEATYPMTQDPNFENWDSILVSADYEFIYFDGLNRFYLRAESYSMLRKHFLTPPNVFDQFVPFRQFGLPFEDTRHPDYIFARQYCHSILRALARETEDHLLHVMTWDIPKAILDQPFDEHKLVDAYRRVLARDPDEIGRSHYLSDVHSCLDLRSLYTELLSSEEFRIRRARILSQ